ncbi:hypothetical protein LJ656_26755 [Paraburkholderia sp. MMS20-SJTR3]|uniref:Uncharacterized protein n=1 Tax=Paraburkholderia sejongensis TaxID=2886946 RepID=A0ABS8K212_9BURK|nr:hypothetical protein [Paraburkholderia sp. MMS20-SJTR3]MCC8396194.1 hypothetical protein [Paraburkholderia sp. MMS20-SJTR3]
MSEQLWCVHIEGPDDFIAVESEQAARREASAINAYLDGAGQDPRAPHVHATAVHWPYGATSHARALDEDHEDLKRMAHRQFAQPDGHRGGVLSNFARRVKELVSVGHADRDDE